MPDAVIVCLTPDISAHIPGNDLFTTFRLVSRPQKSPKSMDKTADPQRVRLRLIVRIEQDFGPFVDD